VKLYFYDDFIIYICLSFQAVQEQLNRLQIDKTVKERELDDLNRFINDMDASKRDRFIKCVRQGSELFLWQLAEYARRLGYSTVPIALDMPESGQVRSTCGKFLS
jgi:hypothetical protein